MPELPDIEQYREGLARRFTGTPLEAIRLASPFVLRTYSPKPEALVGKKLLGVERLGKRLVLAFEEDLFLVLHLMIAGRLRLREHGAKVPGKIGLLAVDFPSATLVLTEASTQKRASLHVLSGREAVRAMDPGGLEPLVIDRDTFAARLVEGNHTLKRALTDPRHFSGIGNAYSDEILFEARLSPVKLVSRLTPDEITRLYEATQKTLSSWTERLAAEADGAFPETVTAFHPGMAVHGKYGQPCPRCQGPVQRIRYANNEANYCPACQNEGKLLADRALSRLLGKEWPKTLEELETYKEARRDAPKETAPSPAAQVDASVPPKVTGGSPSRRPRSSSSRPKSGS
ncbi:MAG: formamidopyrimidine-DNA glycosylase [Myxococcales bacterium]|nr:formamidopyrimidine-DNA glycosylase [Myxococcales bacterium]